MAVIAPPRSTPSLLRAPDVVRPGRSNKMFQNDRPPIETQRNQIEKRSLESSTSSFFWFFFYRCGSSFFFCCVSILVSPFSSFLFQWTGPRAMELPSFYCFYCFFWILPSFTGFYWVLPSFIGFYLVLPSFPRF